MASAFETYVQVELGRRPWLKDDVPEESVLIRRGAGPRQLEGIELGEGQILMNVAGEIQAVTLEDLTSTGSADGYEHIQDTASSNWVIPHGGDTNNLIVQIYDESNHQIIADDIHMVDNDNLVINFSQITIGRAVIMYFDKAGEDNAD